MEQNNITKIIRHFLSGRFPSDLEERVQKWLIKDNNRIEKEQSSFDYWNEMDSEVDATTYSALKRVNRKIGYGGGERNNLFRLSRYNRIVIRWAAVLVPLCFILGGYLYYNSLENQLAEVSTAYGETKYLLLPDSSEVWLNAGTTIQYEKDFGKSQSQQLRLIHLNGEAYFSVRRNEKRPFIVQTQKLSVKVLGTKFNVKAYPDDSRTITTLTSGKVEVSNDAKKHWILKPNQQISYANNGTSADITEITSEDIQVWMDGHLFFINSSFSEMIKTIERRFNVAITCRVDIPFSNQYTIKFLRRENLDEVLNVLGDVVGFSYRKEGEKILLEKK